MAPCAIPVRPIIDQLTAQGMVEREAARLIARQIKEGPATIIIEDDTTGETAEALRTADFSNLVDRLVEGTVHAGRLRGAPILVGGFPSKLKPPFARAKAGRRPVHDWNKAFKPAEEHIAKQGLPDKHTVLEGLVKGWFTENTPKLVPQKRTIEKKVTRRFYRQPA